MFLAAAIAERHAAEALLLASREELRALAVRLQSAREEERARIAREIHDELGQQLTGLKMDVHALMRRMPAEAPPEAGERARILADAADEAVRTVRRISTSLRPGILDDLGVVAAMQWLAQDFEARSGIPVRFSAEADKLRMETEQGTALFRILQEALTNVARHARADTAEVSLRLRGDRLVLEVVDDGVGIAHGVSARSHPTPAARPGWHARTRHTLGRFIDCRGPQRHGGRHRGARRDSSRKPRSQGGAVNHDSCARSR